MSSIGNPIRKITAIPTEFPPGVREKSSPEKTETKEKETVKV